MFNNRNDKKIILEKTRGKFYNAYNENALILSYLTGYKILDGAKCGFPDTAFNKVINKIEENKISYMVRYVNQDPVVKDYKKLNNYDKIYDLAIREANINSRFELLLAKIKNCSNEKLEEVIRILEKCLE